MAMSFTVTEFRGLIHFLETRPEWRMELRRLLFPEALVDLPRAMEELAQAQQRTEETLERVTERMERGFAEAAADRKRIWENIERLTERMERGFAEAAADRKRIWETMQQGFAEAAADRREMRQDVGGLKGLTKEWFYRDRAAAIFGRLLTAGQDATQEVVQRLRTAQQAGRVSAEEYQGVLNADLLWSGELWETGEEVILVLEASWKVHENDVERAVQRAEILRRAGLKALPVTAGEEWPQQVEALALRNQVVITRNGQVDDVSWQTALASLQ
jgi:rubrerythrin